MCGSADGNGDGEKLILRHRVLPDPAEIECIEQSDMLSQKHSLSGTLPLLGNKFGERLIFRVSPGNITMTALPMEILERLILPPPGGGDLSYR